MPPKIQPTEESPIIIKSELSDETRGIYQNRENRNKILEFIIANNEKKIKEKDQLTKSIDRYLYAGNPLELKVEQIARICNCNSYHLTLASIIKNEARLIELKVSAEEITDIASHDRGSINVQAFVLCYEKLQQLGFNREQIIKMTANVGGGNALNTVIRLFAELNAILELTEIVTLAANVNSTKALEEYVKLSPALLRYGFTKEQIIDLANHPAAANNLIIANKIFAEKTFKSLEPQTIIEFLVKKSRTLRSLNIMFEHIPTLKKIFTDNQIIKIASHSKSNSKFFEALTKGFDQFVRFGFSKEEIVIIATKTQGPLIIKILVSKGSVLFNYFSTHDIMQNFKSIALGNKAHLKLPAIAEYIENSTTDPLPNDVMTIAETAARRKRLTKKPDANKATQSAAADIIPSSQVALYPPPTESFSQWCNTLKKKMQKYIAQLNTRQSNENCTALAMAITQLLQGKRVKYVTAKNIQAPVTVMNNNQQFVTYLTVESTMHDSVKKILYQLINFQHNFYSISDESEESKESNQPGQKLILSHCTIANLKRNLTKTAIDQNQVVIALIHHAGAYWHFFNAIAFPNNAGQAAFFLVDAQLPDKVYDCTTDEKLLQIDQVCLQSSSEIAYATVASIDFATAFSQPNLRSQTKLCGDGNKRKKPIPTTQSSLKTKKQKTTSTTSSSETVHQAKANDEKSIIIFKRRSKQPEVRMKKGDNQTTVTWKFSEKNVKIINIDTLRGMLKKIFENIKSSLEEKKAITFNFNPGKPTSLSGLLFVNAMTKHLFSPDGASTVGAEVQDEKNRLTHVMPTSKDIPAMTFNLQISKRGEAETILRNFSCFMLPWLVFFASISQKWNFIIKAAKKETLIRLKKTFCELDKELPKIFNTNLNELVKFIKNRDNFIFPQLDLSLKILGRRKGESYFSSSICLFKEARLAAQDATVKAAKPLLTLDCN